MNNLIHMILHGYYTAIIKHTRFPEIECNKCYAYVCREKYNDIYK